MQTKREYIINWLADLGTKYWLLQGPILLLVGSEYLLRKIRRKLVNIKIETGAYRLVGRLTAILVSACLTFSLMPMNLYAAENIDELINRIEALPDTEAICDLGYTEEEFDVLSEEVSALQNMVNSLTDNDKLLIEESYTNKLDSLASVSIDHCKINPIGFNHELNLELVNIESENNSNGDTLSVILKAVEGYKLPESEDIIVQVGDQFLSAMNYILTILENGDYSIEMQNVTEDVTISAEGVEILSSVPMPLNVVQYENENDLQSAITNGDTVLVITDINLTKTLKIPASKNVTISGGSLSRSENFTGDMIEISKEGSLTLENVKVDGQSTQIGTFGFLVNATGDFTMNGNTQLINNKNSAVKLSGATFTMNNGLIKNNKAIEYGGAVYIAKANSNFIMQNGEISYNSAGKSGGAIGDNVFTFDNQIPPSITINDGKIEHNSVTGSVNGGAIYSCNMLTITGGSIQFNTAENGQGGGVQKSGGTFNFEGGIIANNQAAEHKGDNILISSGEFTLSGDAKTEKGNVTLKSTITVTEKIMHPIVVGKYSNAKVNDVIANGTDEYQLTMDDLLKFSYYDGKYDFAFKLVNNQIVLAKKLDAVYLNGVIGDDTASGDQTHPVKTFERAKSLMKNDGRIRITGTVTIEDEQEWSLDQNSWGIYRETNFKGALIQINANGKLTLHGIKISGGSIAANAPIIDVFGGKLFLNDGAVLSYNQNDSSYGGGVIVRNGDDNVGFMKINGGSVEYNQSLKGGAGIYVEGRLEIINGNIDKNNNSYLSWSTMETPLGGGILINSDYTSSIVGGTIKNNRAKTGGGIYLMKGELSITDGQFKTNQGSGSGVFLCNAGSLKIGGKVDFGEKYSYQYISLDNQAKLQIINKPEKTIPLDLDNFELSPGNESRIIIETASENSSVLNLADFYVLANSHKYETELRDDAKSIVLAKKAEGMTIELRDVTDFVEKNKTYDAKINWSGDFENPKFTWELEGNASKSTKLEEDTDYEYYAVLTIGEDETAETLTIKTSLDGTGMSDIYTVKVKGNERNQVTVENSYATNSGAGRYKEETTVTINAGTRAGYTFDHWSCSAGDVVINNSQSPTATFTMPKKDVTVTAHWKVNSSSGSSSKQEGIVEKKDKVFYYIKGEPADKGFILLDEKDKMIDQLDTTEFITKQVESEAVYFVKEDKTIAKYEWIILAQTGELEAIVPVGAFLKQYDANYKIYLADENGQLVKEWKDVEGNKYYFNKDYSAKFKYWEIYQNDWYLFDTYSIVRNRWYASTNGRWYYLGNDGRMVKNQWVDGYWINEEGIYWSQLYMY